MLFIHTVENFSCTCSPNSTPYVKVYFQRKRKATGNMVMQNNESRRIQPWKSALTMQADISIMVYEYMSTTIIIAVGTDLYFTKNKITRTLSVHIYTNTKQLYYTKESRKFSHSHELYYFYFLFFLLCTHEARN